MTDLKGEIENSTLIAADVNTTLSVTDRMTRLKLNKEIEDLNNIT